MIVSRRFVPWRRKSTAPLLAPVLQAAEEAARDGQLIFQAWNATSYKRLAEQSGFLQRVTPHRHRRNVLRSPSFQRLVRVLQPPKALLFGPDQCARYACSPADTLLCLPQEPLRISRPLLGAWLARPCSGPACARLGCRSRVYLNALAPAEQSS